MSLWEAHAQMSGSIVMAETVTLLEEGKKKTKLVFLLRATRGHLCTLCLGSYNLLEMYLVLNFSNGVIFFLYSSLGDTVSLNFCIKLIRIVLVEQG